MPVHVDGKWMTDFTFMRTYRFSKEGFERLLQLVGPELAHRDGRGGGLSPAIQLQACLNHLAGSLFQRSTGLCFGGSQGAARQCLIKVVDVLLSMKGQWIYMPTLREHRETSSAMLTRYGLNGFSLAVDGVHCLFMDEPMGLPDHITDSQVFYGRKARYSINCQVVGNDHRICDIDCQWPGSVADARVWRLSQVKPIIEQQTVYKCAADSGYPISHALIKPYPRLEALHNPRKARFNSKLSGIRTIMSENIFGRWKRRFPILRQLRCHLELSQKIIVATAILENIATAWNEDIIEPHLPDPPHEGHQVIYNDSRDEALLRGQAERDILLEDMIL